MFGLGNVGTSGLIMILIMVLIVFGPKRLPGIGKALGKSIREFRDATSHIVSSGDDEPDDSATAPMGRSAPTETVMHAAVKEPNSDAATATSDRAEPTAARRD